MKEKTITIFTFISMVFCVAFVCLYIYTLIFNPRLYPPSVHVSFCYFNVTVTKLWGGDLIFYNQEAPYTGGIYSMGSEHSISEKGWDGFGFYFRLIKDSKMTGSWWTLMINLWYLIVIFGILPALFAVSKWRATHPK